MLATFVEVLSVPLLAGAAAGIVYLGQRMVRARRVPVVRVVRSDGKVCEMPIDDERIQRHL